MIALPFKKLPLCESIFVSAKRRQNPAEEL